MRGVVPATLVAAVPVAVVAAAEETSRFQAYGGGPTRGWVPSDPVVPTTRHDDEDRRTTVMADELGDGYELVVEGPGGRTTDIDDPNEPKLNGADYLPAALLRRRRWPRRPVPMASSRRGAPRRWPCPSSTPRSPRPPGHTPSTPAASSRPTARTASTPPRRPTRNRVRRSPLRFDVPAPPEAEARRELGAAPGRETSGGSERPARTSLSGRWSAICTSMF
jgi:hypothetical protein